MSGDDNGDWGQYGNGRPLYGKMDYPGDGYAQRVGEHRPALTAWERLSRGKTLGGSVRLPYNASVLRRQFGPSNLLDVSGDDADACQIRLTLTAPRISRIPFSSVAQFAISTQDPTQTNEETGADDFPGSSEPALWPPFEAVVEFGVGGRNEVFALDFVNGAAVDLTASFLRVRAAVPNLAGAGILGTSAIYELAAFAGPSQGHSRAQKTVWCGVVPSLTESAVFPVPKFARTAYVVGCDPSASAVTVEVTVANLRFWQSADGVAGGHNVGNFVAAGNQAAPFDVPAGAAYASIASLMSVDSRFSIVYGLAL